MFTAPSNVHKTAFTKGLLLWNSEQNTRQMPWKGEKDPYRIWISEIILQQTRVEQGLAYYNNFIRSFPTVQQLAKAPDEKVFKCWEGLGYYSRCRNLLATARLIVKEYQGRFPDTYEEIIALKGVGPYTAAAISSFAFQLPHAVVDGNVFRVLSRFFGIDTATDSTAGKKLFTTLAQDLLEHRQPGIYNQAIMDFGAVICKPAAPLCSTCTLQKKCVAFQQNKVDVLPVKQKKTAVRERWFNYFVLLCKDEVAVQQRTQKDIWQDLYEFPLLESDRATRPATLLKQDAFKKWLGNAVITRSETVVKEKQLLSHQRIHGQFICLELDRKPAVVKKWQWVKKKKLSMYSFPGLINQYLSEYPGL
jgi:A/G-specific adenine glycosylase